MEKRHVFVTGGTGYMGSRLISTLCERGHTVSALVRPGSESKLPPASRTVTGNALDAQSVAEALPADTDTFVHLVGTAHPSPLKAQEFRDVDLASIRASAAAVAGSALRHFIYVSVAHPAPVMKAYIDVRKQGEELVRAAGIPATIIRPWYVLGPGHWWPYAVAPVYKLLELLPGTRQGALRLGLVSLGQMIASLVFAVEHAPQGVRVVDVPQIKSLPPLLQHAGGA